VTQFDPDAYDEHQAFVAAYGGSVVDLLDPDPGERLLDLGCGTGHLTADIADRGASVLGIDRSAATIERARETYPDLRFERADARAVETDEPFDAVFSNAALHWIPADDQNAVLRAVADVLRPGRRFVAEMGGTGNVAAIVGAVRAECRERGYGDAGHPWYFPTVGEYATCLEAAGFEVRHARLFDRPTELPGRDGLANWLDQFGDDLLAGVPETDRTTVVGAVEDRLRDALFDGNAWTADYRRLRFAAVLDGE